MKLNMTEEEYSQWCDKAWREFRREIVRDILFLGGLTLAVIYYTMVD